MCQLMQPFANSIVLQNNKSDITGTSIPPYLQATIFQVFSFPERRQTPHAIPQISREGERSVFSTPRILPDICGRLSAFPNL